MNKFRPVNRSLMIIYILIFILFFAYSIHILFSNYLFLIIALPEMTLLFQIINIITLVLNIFILLYYIYYIVYTINRYFELITIDDNGLVVTNMFSNIHMHKNQIAKYIQEDNMGLFQNKIIYSTESLNIVNKGLWKNLFTFYKTNKIKLIDYPNEMDPLIMALIKKK
jgi:hypothetical protein